MFTNLSFSRERLEELTQAIGLRRPGSRCQTETAWYLREDGAIESVDDPCGRPDCLCPACRASYTYQRSARGRDLFARSRLPTLHTVTITVPVPFRAAVYSDIRTFRRAAWSLVADYYAAKGQEVGGYCVFHPEGDRNAAEDVAVQEGEINYHPHFHVLIACRSGYIEPRDLAALKLSWAGFLQAYSPSTWDVHEILQTARGLDYMALDIQTEYTNNPAEINHHFRYQLRHFVLWTAKATRAVPMGTWGPRSVLKPPPLDPVAAADEPPRASMIRLFEVDGILRSGVYDIAGGTVPEFRIPLAAVMPGEFKPKGDYAPSACQVFRRYTLPPGARDDACYWFGLAASAAPAIICQRESGGVMPEQLPLYKYKAALSPGRRLAAVRWCQDMRATWRMEGD